VRAVSACRSASAPTACTITDRVVARLGELERGSQLLACLVEPLEQPEGGSEREPRASRVDRIVVEQLGGVAQQRHGLVVVSRPHQHLTERGQRPTTQHGIVGRCELDRTSCRIGRLHELVDVSQVGRAAQVRLDDPMRIVTRERGELVEDLGLRVTPAEHPEDPLELGEQVEPLGGEHRGGGAELHGRGEVARRGRVRVQRERAVGGPAQVGQRTLGQCRPAGSGPRVLRRGPGGSTPARHLRRRAVPEARRPRAGRAPPGASRRG
jgi:hypothetical protein